MPVYKDKNKHWYFVVTINYKQYKRVKWNNQYMLSKTEALKCEREFIDSISLSSSNITLYKLFDEFTTATKSTLKVSTQYKYVKFKRNYLVLLPDKSLKDLTIADITKWKNELAAKDLTIEYKNRTQNLLKKVLEYGAIAYDLKAKLQIPLLTPFKENNVKDITKKEKWLKKSDFLSLIKPLEINSYWYVVIWVLYFTGLRIGELAALQVKDIEIDHLTISKDYIRVNGKDYIQAPKNKNSIRVVALDDVTSKLLFKFFEHLGQDDYIFNIKKHFLNQQRLRRILNKLQDEANLNDLIITPHTLRHSYSSNLKALGYNEYVISKLMGNTPEVASSTYIHADINLKEISQKIKEIK